MLIKSLLIAAILTFSSLFSLQCQAKEMNNTNKTIQVTTNKEVFLVEEQYIVQDNDTIDSIARKFIIKNTAGKRYLPEFIQGIIENNTWLVKRSPKYSIAKNDVLLITYFVKKE